MNMHWNEIKTPALSGSNEPRNTDPGEAEANPFLETFLNVFGIYRKKLKVPPKELDTSTLYLYCSFGELYNPGTMPPVLVNLSTANNHLHQKLKE